MSHAYEIPTSWRRADCTDLCWQRFVRLASGFGGAQMLTHHDLDGHERAWLEAQACPVIETGPLIVDPWRKSVSVDGINVSVTPTEFSILHYLALRLDAAHSYQDILRHVWKCDIDPTAKHLIRTNVARLRGRLGDARTMIVTSPNFGYSLRDVPPCASFEIPPAPAPSVLDCVTHRPMLGPRQEALLALLRAAPDHRLTVRQVLVGIWGRSDNGTSGHLAELCRRLRERGHAARLERGAEAYSGWVLLDDEAGS